jgi:ABC-2 type transport system permease protein
MFAVFFLSSMSMPRDLIAVHWFRTVATWNPASYLIEGPALARSSPAGTHGAVARAGRRRRRAALSFWAASRALATRMART